jgi:hypothetical protein
MKYLDAVNASLIVAFFVILIVGFTLVTQP